MLGQRGPLVPPAALAYFYQGATEGILVKGKGIGVEGIVVDTRANNVTKCGRQDRAHLHKMHFAMVNGSVIV